MISTASTSLVLGVDGGQSGTAAVLGLSDGRVLGIGIAGPVHHPDTPDADSANLTTLRTAVDAAFRQAGLPRTEPVAAAHVATTTAITQLEASLRQLLQPAQLSAGSDAETILATAGRSAGVGLAAGTGTVTMVSDGVKRIIHGGWGWLLGDEGSAYWIGVEAIRAVVRGHDGRGRPTSLEQPLLEALGVPSLTELFEATHSGRLTRPAIARLARLVADQATHDGVAAEIVERAGDELAAAAEAAYAQLSTAPPVLVTTGGVLDPSGPVFASLRRRTAERLPEFVIVPATLPPAVAAYLLALGRQNDAVFTAAAVSSAALHPDLRKDTHE